MNIPDLSQVVDTFVPVEDDYLATLKEKVIRTIIDLENKGKLNWFSFLLHEANQPGDQAEEGKVYIHIRLEPMQVL